MEKIRVRKRKRNYKIESEDKKINVREEVIFEQIFVDFFWMKFFVQMRRIKRGRRGEREGRERERERGEEECQK